MNENYIYLQYFFIFLAIYGSPAQKHLNIYRVSMNEWITSEGLIVELKTCLKINQRNHNTYTAKDMALLKIISSFCLVTYFYSQRSQID